MFDLTGKSALVTTFLSELPGDIKVISVECSPVTHELPFATVSDMLRIVTEKGLEFQGEYIPIEPANRVRLAAAVKELRKEKRANKAPAPVTPDALDKRFDKLVADVNSIVNLPERHAAAVHFLERAHSQFDAMLRIVRRTPIPVK